MSFNNLTKKYITSIYNTRINAFSLGNKVTLVHKEQCVPGTTDEKLPYVLLSLRQDSSFYKVLVLEGLGWREASLDWAESYCTNNSIRLFYSVTEANVWLDTLING